MRCAFLAVLSILVLGVPSVAAEPPANLDDAKTSLVQLAAWFDALPPAERAATARELRRWLDATYGGIVQFPFVLPSDEEIAAWESVSEPPATQPAPAEPVTPSAPRVPIAPPPPPPPPLPKTPQAPKGCNTLTPFDTDGDGVLTALDRHWRHVYLWFDSNGDGRPGDDEMVAPYERKIREIGADLRHFDRGKGKKASRGEIEIGEYLLLDTEGNGFGATSSPLRDDAALAVDADALRRDPRGLDLRDAAGAEVTGIQPFIAGWRIHESGGGSVEIDCPR